MSQGLTFDEVMNIPHAHFMTLMELLTKGVIGWYADGQKQYNNYLMQHNILHRESKKTPKPESISTILTWWDDLVNPLVKQSEQQNKKKEAGGVALYNQIKRRQQKRNKQARRNKQRQRNGHA